MARFDWSTIRNGGKLVDENLWLEFWFFAARWNLTTIKTRLKSNGRITMNKTYKIGQRFSDGIDTYILAQVGKRKVNLISLDGNRYSDPPVKVIDLDNITQEEFNKISHGDKFSQVNKEDGLALSMIKDISDYKLQVLTHQQLINLIKDIRNEAKKI